MALPENGGLGLRRHLLVLGGVEHAGSHYFKRIAPAMAVFILGQPVDRLCEGVGDRDVGLEVDQHLLTPADDGFDEFLPDFLLPLRDVVNPGNQFPLGIAAIVAIPDVEESLLVLIGRQERGLLPEYLANGFLVEARSVSHVGVRVVERFLFNVIVKPQRYA